MRKFAAVAGLVLGLAIIPGAAGAAPIGTNGCVVGDIYECDIFVDDVTGLSTLDAAGLAPGWLVGYTFLLNVAADLSDGIQASDVAHALVFHSDFINLYTPIVGSSVFSNIVAAALAGVAIDGTLLSDGQIIGTPIPSGSTQLDGVGTFLTAQTVSMLVNWGDAFFAGADSLTVHTGIAQAVEPPPTGVPEPGSLSLFALGGAGVFASARRRRQAGKIA